MGFPAGRPVADDRRLHGQPERGEPRDEPQETIAALAVPIDAEKQQAADGKRFFRDVPRGRGVVPAAVAIRTDRDHAHPFRVGAIKRLGRLRGPARGVEEAAAPAHGPVLEALAGTPRFGGQRDETAIRAQQLAERGVVPEKDRQLRLQRGDAGRGAAEHAVGRAELEPFVELVADLGEAAGGLLRVEVAAEPAVEFLLPALPARRPVVGRAERGHVRALPAERGDELKRDARELIGRRGILDGNERDAERIRGHASAPSESWKRLRIGPSL